MNRYIIAAALLLASPALAAETSEDTLTAEDKALYLRCAYILNGHSMVGAPAFSSIDMSRWTKEQLQGCVEQKPIAEPAPAKRKKPI